MYIRRLNSTVLALCALFLAGPGCGLGPSVLVSVQLQTDLSPRNEFDQVRTTIGDSEQIEAVAGTESFLEPVAVAEMQVSTGTTQIRVQLLDGERVVAERLLIVEVRTDSAFVVFVSATCRDIICPQEGETCIDGECRDATDICGGRACGPLDCPGGVCGTMSCADTSDCTPTADGCSDPECIGTVCVGSPREDACEAGFYCAIGIGCISVPPDVNPDGGVPEGGIPEGGIPEGGIPDGGDAGIMGVRCPCMTTCGSMGTFPCDAGEDASVPTGECDAPAEDCGLGDEDCDGTVDEGIDCSHTHPIVCQVGMRRLPDMTLVRNIASIVRGGGPGLICAGGVCQSFLNNCETLPVTGDSHVHPVTLGGAALTILDDTPFSSAATVASAGGHSHGATCGIGEGSGEIRGGFFYHRIMDDLGEPTRFDQFCVPPVGSPDSECRSGFGFCETN